MRLYERLEYLSYRLRYEATYLEMKYHLKKVIRGKENRFTKKISHYDRNIGKSCALARLSVKYDIPVIVPTQSWASLYTKDIPRYIPKYFKKKLPQTVVANENVRGKKYNVVLIEECNPENIMEQLVIPIVTNGFVGYKNLEIG
jgi:hypothetical protein